MGAIKQNLTSNLHIDKDGTKRYFLPNGKTHHREDGPAIESANGDKEWHLNGKCHREDGPAVESSDGYKAWWIKEKRHRVDGPAIEHPNGDKEWYLNGVEYSFEEWEVARKMLWML